MTTALTEKMMKNFDDAPISRPEEDRFGFNPFANAIAECIRNLADPVGSVVAIYGPWGSGKSSVINLVRHHLEKDDADLTIINFPAWMYRSEDALAVGFFKELYAGLSPVLSKQDKAAGALRKLGATLAGASNLAGMAIGLFAGSLGEKATTAALGALGGFIEQGETAEDLQDLLADALRAEGQRFLVVVDDLDRLSPEEALVIFRLIKSVGRLPNVLYLLAYDRTATEDAVARRFPSEGPHYLEKIVQAGFELPEPGQAHLNIMMGEFIDGLASDLPEIDSVEFGNLFHSVVAPELRTPRDVFRLANTLAITSAPVLRDVFLPDFISLETLRVFRPGVYRAIRAHKSEVLNASDRDRRGNSEELAERFSSMLLGTEPEADHPTLRDALMRLFPQLQYVFANTIHSGRREWSRQRRVCSASHFDTYFRFDVSPETVPQSEIDYLLNPESTVAEIQAVFLEAIGVFQAKGRSKASYLLDELTAHGETVPLNHAEMILTAVFGIADDLFIEQDEERGLGIADNRFRLHWLLRAFLRDRTDLDQRSDILMRCCEQASLQWLLDFSRSAWGDHYPSDSERGPSSEDDTLLTLENAESLRQTALGAIRSRAADGTLLDAVGPARVLFEWDDLKEDESDEVMQFTAAAMDEDEAVIKLAKAFLGKSFSHGMGGFGGSPGDLVYRENDRAQIDGLERLLDLGVFRSRLEQLVDTCGLNDEDRQIIQRFLTAWNARDDGRD